MNRWAIIGRAQTIETEIAACELLIKQVQNYDGFADGENPVNSTVLAN
jgi:hypothetical protein